MQTDSKVDSVGCRCLAARRDRCLCFAHPATHFCFSIILFMTVSVISPTRLEKNPQRNHMARKTAPEIWAASSPRCGFAIISHLKTVTYLAVRLRRPKRRPNYSITPSLMVSMAALCIFPRDAPWRNECLINHHPGNNTPSSLCRMCQTLTRTLGEIFLPVQPQPLIWT